MGNEDLQLNRQHIVCTAIALADREGIAAITMRRLADELGSKPMSLYRHIPNKDAVLDLMLDTAFGEIRLPDHPSGEWPHDLQDIAWQTRALLRRHAWLAALMSHRPPLGPNYHAYLEFSLTSVAAAHMELDITTIARVVGSIHAYVLGMVGYELAEADVDRGGDTNTAPKPEPSKVVQIDPTQYPQLARFFADIHPGPDDGAFAFGLECLLDGLTHRLSQYARVPAAPAPAYPQ